MPQWGQTMFQDAVSPIMHQMIHFHDYTLIILTLVMTTVAYAFFMLMTNKLTARNLKEAQQVETIWTILPAIILTLLAMPSLRLLYLTDELNNPSMTVKAIGHQWYWSYQYSDFMEVEFDSYMTPPSELSMKDYRLLEVDNRTVLPMNTEIRLLITASDVIHSWTVPAIGVKVDAIPGRLNQLGLTINRPGIFYGQCSEICGANHSFMPISIESVNTPSFISWTNSFSNK